jgi:hypothetical protein
MEKPWKEGTDHMAAVLHMLSTVVHSEPSNALANVFVQNSISCSFKPCFFPAASTFF